MAWRDFSFDSDEDYKPKDSHIFIGYDENIGHHVKLRAVDSMGCYSPLEPLKESYIDFPGWCPSDIFDSFFGFSSSYKENGGCVRFQISPDNGETFLWHDGTSWIAFDELSLDYTEEEQRNTSKEIQEFITDFPKAWTSLKIRMFLTPSPMNVSPVVSYVTLYVTYREHSIEKDVIESFITFLEERFNFVFPFEFIIPEEYGTISEYAVTHEDIGIPGDVENSLKIKEPIWVYELETDPKKRDNLFESFDETDNIIRFKRPISGHIRIVFTGIPEIIAHKDFDYDEGRKPSYPVVTLEVISTVRASIDGPGNARCYEINEAKKISRFAEGLRRYEVTVRTRPYTSKTVDSYMLTGGVRRSIEQEDRIKSVNYDEYMIALWGPQTDSNWVIENLFAQQLLTTFIWKDWSAQDKPKDVPLVDTEENGGGFRIHLGLINDC